MKKIVVLVAILAISFAGYAQQKSNVLLTINKEKIYVDDFKRVYEKNLDAIDNEEAKSVTNNLELFINYKLKVKEAYAIKLDTLPSYKREIETYRNQLSAPYLQDKKFTEKLVEEAYFRTKNEVKAKHILLRLKENAPAKDTLVVFEKMLRIRNRILAGEDFEKVAEEVSEDASARDNAKRKMKGNKGNLGFFSAFKMVYNFEDAAYNTKVGEVSLPFRTRFGYHIVKVDSFRVSKGEIEVAHILLNDTTVAGKKQIDAIYKKLQNNEPFKVLAKEYSKDEGSKNKGGRLHKFGAGRMVPSFDKAAFALENENDFSKPFRTRFGWHIVKLLKKHPVKSFADMKQEITSKLKRSGRMKLSDDAVLNKLKKKYAIVDNEQAKEILNRKDIRTIAKDSLQNTLFSINNKNIKQVDFVAYLINRRHKPTKDLFEMFKDQEILAYFKENLVNTEPDYANTLEEYEDGLLLFELMQQKIWNKSTKDTLGLQSYFVKNKSAYKSKELKDVKGQVINDYQGFLEQNWIANLRKKNKVKIRKKELKKLIKFYEKK